MTLEMPEPINALMFEDLSDDFVTKFSELIDDAFEDLTLLPLDIRLSVVDDVIERYFAVTKEVPKPYVLDRLAHVLSWDYMEGDTRSNKSRKEEYPILTEAQYERRTSGNNHKTTFYETSREVYVDMGYLASDGRDYRRPVRRYE